MESLRGLRPRIGTMNGSNGFNRKWTQMDANDVAMVWESKMCFSIRVD